MGINSRGSEERGERGKGEGVGEQQPCSLVLLEPRNSFCSKLESPYSRT
jgi:hypothetical protein